MEIVTVQTILGRDFTVYGTTDEPLFLAKDVASWIEHTDMSRMVNLVDEEEKLKRTLYVSGQKREMWFLTEDGLYEVLMQSRKPVAKSFKKEVKTVLKSLRKHGLYATAPTIENILENPDYGIELLQKLKQERAEREALQLKLIEAQPKVTYYDTILQSDDLMTIRLIAQDYGISASKLNQILHEQKIQYKDGKTWYLYSDYQGHGYVKTQTFPYTRPDGTSGSKVHMSWTQKGRLLIHDLLTGLGIIPDADK
ncbi:MAG: phage antirepressor KilAC domain-containing protein [Bacilli bacterium]